MYIRDKTERASERARGGGCAGIEPTRLRQTTASPHIFKTLDSDRAKRRGVSLGLGENQRPHAQPSPTTLPSQVHNTRSCGPQARWRQRNQKIRLYSTCASPVVPHPSTGHAHGCLASEIGRDPAFPTRFDRTVASLEVSLLAPSRLGRDCKEEIERE
jgi:hypothetical protein